MAPRLHAGSCFPSLKKFQEELQQYQKQNHVLFKVTSSKAIKWANKRLEPEEIPLSEVLVYKHLTLKCKSGGYERPSQSKGLRPFQRTLNIGCQAQITLLAESSPAQRLRVTILKEEHSHPTTEEFLSLYPDNKQLDLKKKEKAAEMMILCKGKPTDTRFQLKNTVRRNVTQRNFSKLWQEMKRKGETDEEDLIAELEDMVTLDPGSSYKIGYVEEVESDGDETQHEAKERQIDFIIFQTSEMSKNLTCFPDILGMDTTLHTRNHNMNMVTIQAVDNHGNAKVVAYVLVRRETSDILEAALSTFAKVNEEVMPHVKTVLVDKDYKDIRRVKNILPHAHVHLCHTRVIRIFKREAKAEPNAQEVMKRLGDMSVSGSSEEFEKHYEALKQIASTEFIGYFDEYWKSIDSAWVLYVPNTSLSLGMRSFNGKIKSVVEKTNTLADLVRRLLFLHESGEFPTANKDLRAIASRSYIANNSEPDIQLILDTVTDWGGKLLISEFKESIKLKSDIEIADENSCSCNFFLMFGMKHCRHIFHRRRISGQDLLALAEIPTRWLKTSRVNESDSDGGQRTPLGTSGGSRKSIKRGKLKDVSINIATKRHKYDSLEEEMTKPGEDSLVSYKGQEEIDQEKTTDFMEIGRFNVDTSFNNNNNKNLVDKTKLLLDLFNTVSLSQKDNSAIEKQLDRLIESVNKGILDDFNDIEVVHVK